MTPRLAVVGLGRMGLPVCRRLVAAGFPVTATDIAGVAGEAGAAGQGGAAGEPEGWRWAGSAAEACAEADIAVTVLPGPDEVVAVSGEIVGTLARGACWLDLSTASPAASRAVVPGACSRSVDVVDAPMGGGPEEARDGRLLVFAGGSEAAVARCRPVLDAVARRVLHVGPVGSGYAVKLLVNTLWFGQAVATAEALTVARRLGLDLEVVVGAVGESAAGSRFLERYAPALLAGDDMKSFALARCCEELESVLGMGRELDVALPVAEAVDEVHRGALERYGDVDGELLGARWVAERSGVRLDSGSAP